MKLEHTATIASIGPIESIPYGDGKEFKKRVLVLDDPEDQYNDAVVFELGGNSIDLADGFKVGQVVTVKANVSCRENKRKPGQFFTGLRAWSVRGVAGDTNKSQSESEIDRIAAANMDQDIPF